MNVRLLNDLITMKRDIRMACLHCVFFSRREGHLESNYSVKWNIKTTAGDFYVFGQ